MNTEKQAQQLRLAADILETGHPFEYDNGEGWFRPPHGNPLWPISNRREIRLALATPPDGRPLHNPDNFTAEQVGVGYRLLLKEEVDFENHDGSEFRSALNLTHTWKPGRWRWDRASSIRLPLSVPWPPAPVDPYADPETVPLGPEDVHPHARFRGKTSYKPNHTPWITPLCVNRKGLVIASPSTVIEVSWPSLRDDYERNESLATGKWNPDAWEPCHKPAP